MFAPDKKVHSKIQKSLLIKYDEEVPDGRPPGIFDYFTGRINRMRRRWIGLAGALIFTTAWAFSVMAETDYSSKEIVQAVQQALGEQGYDCGTPDGIAGSLTREAIAAYRAAKRVGSGDQIDEELLDSLGISAGDTSEFDADDARKAAVVAFTNRFATDVLTDDGSDYDENKFHAYGDESGFHLIETDPGTWTEENGVFKGEHLKMESASFGGTFDVNVHVEKAGDEYRVYDITGSVPSYPDVSALEDEDDYERFFTVDADLVKGETSAPQGTEENSAEDSTQVSGAGVSIDDASGVTPELKEFLDSYEAFMNEYCDFMETYDASDLGALVTYMDLLGKYSDFADKADDYDTSEMSDADLKYYLDVTTRIEKRLIDTGAAIG